MAFPEQAETHKQNIFAVPVMLLAMLLKSHSKELLLDSSRANRLPTTKLIFPVYMCQRGSEFAHPVICAMPPFRRRADSVD